MTVSKIFHPFARRVDPYLLLLLVLSFFALTPLLAPGYFYTAHDGRHSVFFVTIFDEAIRDGAWWPTWGMHHAHGYGYPTFLLQAPIAFYVAEIFILLGLGITDAVKIAWSLGFFASAGGMYALMRYWLGETDTTDTRETKAPATTDPIQQAEHAFPPVQRLSLTSLAALVAGLLYVYAPYHLVDIYVRAAFAETMLMAWLPWVFLAFDRLIVGGAASGWQGRLLVAALSYAGLLLTHVFALLAVTPLLVAFVLFRLWGEWRGRNLQEPVTVFARQISLAAGGGSAAVLLTAIFVLPLVVEGPLLVQEDFVRATYAYERHWVHWAQFLNPFWGYGYSDDPIGANDGMSFQLGLILALLALVALALRCGGREGVHGYQTALLLFLLLSTVVLLFIMTPAAGWLWRSVPMLALLQFPWRLLALASFLLSALGGLVLWQVSQTSPLFTQVKDHGVGLLIMGLVVICASYTYSHPQALQPIEPWREDGRAIFQFEQEHPDMLGYTDQVEERFTETPMSAQYQAVDFANDQLERLAILTGDGAVTQHYSRGHSFGGEVVMASPGTVQVRVYDFPGWQVRLNREPVVHRVSLPHALIALDVPVGRHQIDVRMGSTPIRRAGATISGLTLLVLVGLWGYSRFAWAVAQSGWK